MLRLQLTGRAADRDAVVGDGAVDLSAARVVDRTTATGTDATENVREPPGEHVQSVR